MRIVFFGTPRFAVPTLRALHATGDLAPELVVSQPSRPAGRGRKTKDPPVVEAARELDLPVEQPKTVRDAGFLQRLRDLAPDVAVVVAFGQIFRRELLDLPRLGCVNLHASLLPKYRGAAPIQAAIAAGDAITGVTTMKMGEGLDTGPVLLRREVPIGPDQTSADMAPILAEAGAELVVETLRGLEAGELEEIPQDDARAVYAPKIEKADGRVDWKMSARALHDLWRAYQPWPGLHAELGGETLKLRRLRPATEAERRRVEDAELDVASLPAGSIAGLGLAGDASSDAGSDRPLLVVCGAPGSETASSGATGGGDRLLAVERLQRPGKKPVSGADLLNGERLRPGDRLA